MKYISPADMNMALDAMQKKIDTWGKEHPNEKMPVCPKCNNIGLIRRVYDEFGNEMFGENKNKEGTYDYYEPCICIKPEKNQLEKNNRRFATTPSLYQDADFGNFRTDIYSNVKSRELAVCAKNDSIQYVSHFEDMEKRGMGLYIWSNARGSGKSRLASSISNELVGMNVRNKFASASGILSEIQKSWNDKEISEEKIIRNYIEPRVLIIDDLGARSGQQWMDEKFLMIVDNRYQHNKVTIFTSNYDVDGLPFKDMRIIDRLNDVDRFYKVRMPDETLRNRSRAGGDLFHKIIRDDD